MYFFALQRNSHTYVLTQTIINRCRKPTRLKDRESGKELYIDLNWNLQPLNLSENITMMRNPSFCSIHSFNIKVYTTWWFVHLHGTYCAEICIVDPAKMHLDAFVWQSACDFFSNFSRMQAIRIRSVRLLRQPVLRDLGEHSFSKYIAFECFKATHYVWMFILWVTMC